MSTTQNTQVVRGFSLIELMVAVSIFSIVMMIGVGALLSMVAVNKRAQAINSVMNNLNAAVEEMSRSIRVGTSYHCEVSAVSPPPSTLAVVKDCASGGGRLFAFEATGGNPALDNDQTVYRLSGTQLERSLNSGQSWLSLTAPEVEITNFQFYVTGTSPYSAANLQQPRVLISIRGRANIHGGTTEFLVQSSVTQRLLDI